MALHYLDPTREPRECPCDCHESPETDDPDCPTCHGTGRLGEEGAEPDVEIRRIGVRPSDYEYAMHFLTWKNGVPRDAPMMGLYPTEAAALAAARKAHLEGR